MRRIADNVHFISCFLRCVKSVQIWSFFWSVFSSIWTEYGEIRSISPYSDQMLENTDQKNFRIWTHFTQCLYVHSENILTKCFYWSLEFVMAMTYRLRLFLCWWLFNIDKLTHILPMLHFCTLRFSDVFRGYRNVTLGEYGLN